VPDNYFVKKNSSADYPEQLSVNVAEIILGSSQEWRDTGIV
jgi:hypothetical protein